MPGITARSLRVATAGAAVACFLAGCGPIPGLVSSVERSLFCPAERIVTTKRPDLRPHHFACLQQPLWRAQRAQGKTWDPDDRYGWSQLGNAVDVECGRVPPPEIGGDPGRAALWRERRDRALEALDQCSGAVFPCTARVVELSGCGFHGFYGCGRERCRYLGDTAPEERP